MDILSYQISVILKNRRCFSSSRVCFPLQIRNEGDQAARAQLTMLAMAVTYNSLHRGECQRKTISVSVPAHKG